MITNQSILGKFRQNKKQNLGQKSFQNSKYFLYLLLMGYKNSRISFLLLGSHKTQQSVPPIQDYTYSVLLTVGLSWSSHGRQRFFKWDSASRKHSVMGHQSVRYMRLEVVSCVSPYYSPSIHFSGLSPWNTNLIILSICLHPSMPLLHPTSESQQAAYLTHVLKNKFSISNSRCFILRYSGEYEKVRL